MHPIGLASKLAFYENCAQLHFGSISGFWAVSDLLGTQLFDLITYHVLKELNSYLRPPRI